MKKILLTILLTSLPACAFENYMIISETPVKSVAVQNPEILSAQPVFTIDNEKKIIVVTPKSSGKTSINIDLYGNKKNIEVKVTESSTHIKPQDGFNYYVMELPPQTVDILPPPMFRYGGS